MNFSEQPPSKQWAALKYRGESVAGFWFKPEGEPFALRVRIPRKSFQLPGIGQRVTPEYLLGAVGISAEEVESWRYEDVPGSDTNESFSELGNPLPTPPPDVSHLTLYVSLKPPPSEEEVGEHPPEGESEELPPEEEAEEGPPLVAVTACDGLEVPEATWQYLDARWEAILNVEASVDSLRSNMEGLRAEMDAAAKRALPLEEKTNALSSDVVFWNKAKNRIRYALPKLNEYIHRSTWAKGAAERKTAEEYFTNYVQPRTPSAQLDHVRAQFDHLLKNRQLLNAQSVAVHQECRRILSDVEGALRTLQRNAASNAAKKKSAARKKGKL